MNKEIRVVDQQKNLVRITTVDERWYARTVTDATTGLPVWQYVPSVTWIAEHYPKGIGFYKWLANHGWDEAEAIKEAAGNKGSKVHMAVTNLIDGETVEMDAKYPNDDGVLEPLTLEEYDAILSFAAWYEERRPNIIFRDMTVWNDQENYAGTLDLMFLEDAVLWIPDVKTSKYIWPSHEIQVSAYKHTAQIEDIAKRVGAKEIKLAILQLGYPMNKKRFKFTPVEDQFELFLAAKKIWAKETTGQSPKQRDYPLRVSIAAPLEASAQTPQAESKESSNEANRGQAANGLREGNGRRVVGGKH